VSTGSVLDSAGAADYRWGMNTVHLSDVELALARHAMQAYLRSFGHDEADTVQQIKSVIAKLDAAENESDDPVFVG
jgi:hypothetical protein